MENTYFFGYGSLVNHATHNYDDCHLATLQGWRRVWRHISPFTRAILSVERDENSTIPGLIAGGPDVDWAVLDERESAYEKAKINGAVMHPMPHEPALILYTIAVEKHPPAATPQPILLSYIDVVTQGYLQVYGHQAATAFFTETAGWTGGIVDDRHAPIYPRHQKLSKSETAFVDDQINALSAVVKQS